MNYIFVDVDGVLNPFSKHEGFDTHLIPVSGVAYNVYLNKEHGKWLTKLAEDTKSELVWGTTWQEEANDKISWRVGLPRLPYLTLKRERLSESLGTTKARAARKHAEDSKFVYFDDEYDIGYALEGTKGLHVYVHPELGLTEDHINTARQYLLS